MTRIAMVRVLLAAAILTFAVAQPVRAQDRGVEIGTSLASLMVGFGDGTGTVLGIPSGGFGIFNPGLFVSIFIAPRISVEPQVGLIVISSEGETAHLASVAGQVNYFFRGTRESSPYVFGSVGFFSATGGESNPASVSGGAGYRMALGDRLTVRADGRITHFTEGGGNAFTMTVSLGGVFGRN
jgi:hypothetical protein